MCGFVTAPAGGPAAVGGRRAEADVDIDGAGRERGDAEHRRSEALERPLPAPSGAEAPQPGTPPAAKAPRLEATSPLRVEEAEGAGRFFVAARPIASGERLLVGVPEAMVVDESYVSRVCAHCMKESKKGKLTTCCAECRYVHYCSTACQVAAGDAHALECVALARLKRLRHRLGREQITHLRLLLQIMYSKRHADREGCPEAHPTETLVSGRQDFVGMKDWASRQKAYKVVTNTFASVCGYDMHWTVDEVEHLLGAIQCNAFGVWLDGRDRGVGLGICVTASLFNHSCAPNVGRTTDGRDIEFFALTPLAEGEQLCISYLDPRETVGERRAHLSHCYGFTCRCARCQGRAELPRMCHKHLGYIVEGGSPGAPSWCTACGRGPRGTRPG